MAGHILDGSHPPIIGDAVSLFLEFLGQVEGQPLRRPAPGGGGYRDAVPAEVAQEGQVTRVFQ